MKLREIVGINLARHRRRMGLAQEELADRANLNRNYVGMLEQAKHAATVDTLEKLATVLEIDPAELLQRPLPTPAASSSL